MRKSFIAALLLALPALLPGSPVATALGADGFVQAPAPEKRRVKTIIVDNYRPYTFLNDSGQPDGFSVELLRAVAETIGLELDIRTDTWEHAMKALEQGAIDVLPMMAYSAERDKRFQFSAPHTIAFDSVFVRKGNERLRTLTDLSGKTVAVLNGDAAHEYLVSHGLERQMNLLRTDSLSDALQLVAAGTADAAIMPKLVGLVLAKNRNLAMIVQTSQVIDAYNRPFSFAVKEGDNLLLERLVYGLSVIKTTGQYDEIYKKWFAVLEDPLIRLKTAIKYALAMVAVCLAFVAWTLVLRRQVRSRTRHLQAEMAQRAQAEEALRSSEEKYRGLYREAALGIFHSELGGRFIDVNPALARMLGYESPEEVLACVTSIPDQVYANPPVYNEVARQVLEAGGTLARENCYRRRDGSLWWGLLHLRLIGETQGRASHYEGFIEDITERKHFAEEKSRLEEQLRQAQKVEAIGRLAGGVAHDFNNLTAIVLGYGEMLLGQLRVDEPARKWAEQIVAAGKRSAALTRQLLAFSRRQVLLPVVLDLNGLLRNLEKMFGRLIGEDIALKFDLAGDLGRITVDPGQIEQVVTNLVLNARDAMPQGGRLTVETANVDLDEAFARAHESVVPGEYVSLVLTDSGRGMDKATLARLFEPFFTTKERGKGTGLGLSTAFGIVKQSGGYLYVESEPDKGTRFTIYLPRTYAQPKAPAIESCGEAPQGDGERILLVEDEASLRELCATVLTRFGYRVSTAGSGPEALLLVGEQGFEPDLVVTDVIMPGMSGAEMAQRLLSDRPGLKVLYMSGYPDDIIAPHGILGPGTSFLPKPFSERVLAAKVCEALGDRKSAAARPVRRVLMIDDDEQFLELVGHFCRKRGHVFAGVDSTSAALAALAVEPCNVLLVDLNVPGTSGERILREIRAAGYAAPAIVLTGDIASADMDLLRPLGVVRAIEKSSDPEPLLLEIEKAAALDGPPKDTGAP